MAFVDLNSVQFDEPHPSGGKIVDLNSMQFDDSSQQPQEKGFWDNAAEWTGSAARGVFRGVAGAADIVPNAINAANYVESRLPTFSGRQREAPEMLPTPFSDLMNKYLDVVDVKKKNTAGGRLLEDVGVGVGGGGIGGLQGALMGVSGSASAGLAREAGGGPLTQMAAGALGGVAAGARRPAASNLKISRNIRSFENAGTTPTLGQATENPALMGVESALSKMPGGREALSGKAKTQQAEIGQKIENMSTGLSGKTSAETTGRAIESGIADKHNPDSFVSRSQAKQGKLYSKMDRFLPLETPVKVNNYKAILDKMTRVTPGAEKTSGAKLLTNPTIEDLSARLKEDLIKIPAEPAKQVADEMGNFSLRPAEPAIIKNELPYSAIKDLRSRVGEKLQDSVLGGGDASHAELKQLYGALSEDMKAAAKEAGPEAYAAFERANNYTRAYHDRLDTMKNVVERNGGGEKIFNAAISGTADGATKFRAVMKSLDPETQKAFSATILRRLGKATPGRQNDLGTEFSTETFLTNWNKLSPEAKQVMAMPMSRTYRNDMDSIAKVASNLREGSKVYANPSGTAGAGAATLTTGGIMYALVSGQFLEAALISAGVASSYGLGKALSSPSLVRWMATSGKIRNISSFKEHMTRLQAIGAAQPEIKEDVKSMHEKLLQGIANTKGKQ